MKYREGKRDKEKKVKLKGERYKKRWKEGKKIMQGGMDEGKKENRKG